MNIKPPSILLLGASGTGKTYAIPTLIAAGLEVFVIITEPNGLDTLLDSMNARKLPMDKLHWMEIMPANPGWTSLKSMARTVNLQSYEDLTKLKSGVDKASCQQFISLLSSLENFIDGRTGKAFGDVTELPPTSALVIDSLSGVNVMAMDLTIGFKPVAHQGEWGTAMNLEEKLILQLTSSMKGWFVLIGHLQRETNEITGMQQVQVAALGSKLAPRLSRFFSEVVMAKRTQGRFLWSTSDNTADLKNRGLTFSDALEPSFVDLIATHKRRTKQLVVETEKVSA